LIEKSRIGKKGKYFINNVIYKRAD
jgi:hypothetical protein